MNTFQILLLGGLAAGLLLLGLVLRELRRVVKLRKPLLTFTKTAGAALEVPVKAAALMEQHLAELSALQGNAILSHDMMELEFKRREEQKAALAKAMPAAPMKETGTVAVTVGPEKAGVPEVGLFGAGAEGGKVVKVEGRVDMGAPPGDNGRSIQLGAPSTPDGTG